MDKRTFKICEAVALGLTLMRIMETIQKEIKK